MRAHHLAVLLTGLLTAGLAEASTYSYRGSLDDGGRPAQGEYQFRFTLYNAASGGRVLAMPITVPGVSVRAGTFDATVDLGDTLERVGTAWLAVEVAAPNGAFEALPAREAVSTKALAAGVCWDTTGNAGNVAGTNFVGNTDNVPLDLRTRNLRTARFERGNNQYLPNVILGANANAVTAGAYGATIGGGGQDTPGSEFGNKVTENYSTVAGGIGNYAGDDDGNPSSAQFTTVGGGYGNYATGYGATVAGGYGNGARGTMVGYGVVSGGTSNAAMGDFSTVPGGTNNQAGGDFSFAAGRRARVRDYLATGENLATCGGTTCGDEGAWVWADAQNASFTSTGPNQFLIRADGGVLINTNTGAASADDLTLKARAVGGDADADLVLQTRAGKVGRFYLRESDGAMSLSLSPTGADFLLTNANGARLTSGGAWTNGSSRLFKTAFEAVDAQAVLERVLSLPITTWTYKNSSEGRHMGVMAEDFASAFGLGEDEQHIATVDADGVALAAIQGLAAKVEAQARENAELRARLEALESSARAK